jgi:hypothetical protein
MNSYELSRLFCDWCFENPHKVKPIHYAIYFFAIEHCNRLGWKDNFGLPSQMVMEAIGVKNWKTYSAGLNDLVEFGFIKMIEISKNQYSSNIVAIVKNTKALTKASTKALDKALSKHSTKQGTKQGQSIVSIDKQLNNITIKQLNNITSDQIKNLNFSMFDNLKIIDLWCEWLNFKKDQFNQSYKTEKSNQTAINKLAKLSKNKTLIAEQIIENSISNLYKGLFELKNNYNATGNQNTEFKSFEQRSEEFTRKVLYGDGEQNTSNPFGNSWKDVNCEIVE